MNSPGRIFHSTIDKRSAELLKINAKCHEARLLRLVHKGTFHLSVTTSGDTHNE